ncbi:MAG: nitroreductase family protein [Candidatus Izemoplasmatales bacterium]|nr:nitroreductase family protein [Candidatus Izemoplasmatales bacterium]
MEFLESLKKRRSIYNINKEVKVTEDEILNIIETAVLYTPSAYNSESQRAVVLLNEKHDLLWEIVKEEIKKVVKPEDFKVSETKINGFKNGFGTVLFFDDLATTNDLMTKFALYKDNFYRWSIEQNGMLQGNVWVGLETIGLGASLQHYNELIEKRVKEEFKIDENWQLIGQMPFGNLMEVPAEKSKKALSERLKVIK